MKKRILTKALSVLVSVLTMSMVSMPATASTAKQPDYTRKGSVAVDIRETGGNPVGGGSLTIFHVADAVYDDGDNLFVYKDEFESCGIDPAEIGTEEPGAPEIAGKLAEWAENKGITGIEKTIGQEGRVIFDDLDLGLYLFIQEKPAESYESVRPFVVTVPLWDGEKLVYDVEAGPKVGTATGLASIEPSVKKIFKAKSGTLPTGETFTFRILPAQKDQPMPAPEGSTKDEKTGAVSIVHGAGTFSFGKIWFGSSDVGKTYKYQVSESKGSNSRITYDQTVYTLSVEVKKNETTGNIECITAISGKDGKKVTGITFTNTYNSPPTPSTHGTPGKPGKPGNPKLPQTGQLWWPVPLLALSGILFFGLGRKRSQK